QVQAASINFAFEDQTAFPPPASKRNFDIEGIIWHNDSIVMFTKNRSTPLDGYCKMYKIPAMAGNYTAKLIDSLYLGNTNNEARVTAAAIRHETGELVLLTRARILSFQQYTGGNFFNGEMIIYPFAELPGQAEAIDFVNDNVVYITEEGSSNQPGYLYEAVLRDASSNDENIFSASLLIKKIINHTLFVSLTNEQTEIENVEIIDLKGITVSMSSSGTAQLSLIGLKTGIYILQVATKNGFIIEKIFINE
ncbi:MAG: T9SS type A sorting domain-containing protein, partial [Bacteroidales bacterium]|nr:T9SS type A sorting domain-containing protein [Bacteroidales bacterium]